MTKNPIINALGASGYIVLVVSIINFITRTHSDKPDTAFALVLFLSLLTLSVTMMACLFFYQPLLLFIDGKKKAAVNLFIQTVAVFAGLTAVVLILLLSGLI